MNAGLLSRTGRLVGLSPHNLTMQLALTGKCSALIKVSNCLADSAGLCY